MNTCGMNHWLSRSILCLCLWGSCLLGVCQDLIVTTAGDSVRCTITAVRETKLHYSVVEEGRRRNRTIERGLVKSYRRAGFAPVELGLRTYVPNPQPAPERMETARDTLRRIERKPAWGVFGGYGWTYRVGRIADDLDPATRGHIEGLRSGSQYSFALNYLIGKHFGIGLRITKSMWSNASTDIPFTLEVDSTILAYVETDLSIATVGPAFVWRPTNPSDKTIFTLAISSGTSFYREKDRVDDVPLKVSGESAYLSAVTALDFRLTGNFVVGGSVGFTIGSIRELKYTYAENATQVVILPVDQSIGLQRLQYGLQLGVVF